LEKGMGLPSPRPGFGYEKAELLLSQLENYKKANLDCSKYAFTESVSVLRAYYSFTDNDVEKFKKRFVEVSTGVDFLHAGVDKVDDICKIYESIDTAQIENFISTRHSIRNFEQKAIEDDVIHGILKIASYAPSACNRQPVRVYISTKPETVEKVNQLIPGNKGFEKEVPNWAIVSVNRDMFNDGEPLQWYINGGIYLSYLINAMHAYHIGSCIFQIPMLHPYTLKLKALAAIPDNESIVAAVGFGYPKKENRFIAATRKPLEEVMVEF
jgi:nitroreductase